jgi:hypothetical protein
VPYLNNVLERDHRAIKRRVADALGDALAAIREVWEPETTVRNLRLIREARERQGVAKPWILQIETELAERAASPPQ